MVTGNKREAHPKRGPLKRLSEVHPGSLVRVKRLTAPPEVARRLREVGFYEDQSVRLLHQNGTSICQVSNARMGLCHRTANHIWVEPVSASASAD
jgi:Fe2+ transport system protein FeoA